MKINKISFYILPINSPDRIFILMLILLVNILLYKMKLIEKDYTFSNLEIHLSNQK